VKICR